MIFPVFTEINFHGFRPTYKGKSPDQADRQECDVTGYTSDHL